MSDLTWDFMRHQQFLVGQCPITYCYLQPWGCHNNSSGRESKRVARGQTFFLVSSRLGLPVVLFKVARAQTHGKWEFPGPQPSVTALLLAKCVRNWHFRPSESVSLLLTYFFCLAVKAKSVREVIKNRPAAGILDKALAEEYRVIFNVLCIAYSLH